MPYLGQELIEAVRAENVADITRLLREGADPNSKDVLHGTTPLQAASGAGRLDIAELLLQHGADINLISGDVRQSALEAAAIRGQVHIVKWLLQNGAQLPPPSALRPLVLDLESWGEKEIVELLENASSARGHAK